jgi:hypothetical protein
MTVRRDASAPDGGRLECQNDWPISVPPERCANKGWESTSFERLPHGPSPQHRPRRIISAGDLITASELREFVYCERAGWLTRQGYIVSCDLKHKMAVTAALCFRAPLPPPPFLLESVRSSRRHVTRHGCEAARDTKHESARRHCNSWSDDPAQEL